MASTPTEVTEVAEVTEVTEGPGSDEDAGEGSGAGQVSGADDDADTGVAGSDAAAAAAELASQPAEPLMAASGDSGPSVVFTAPAPNPLPVAAPSASRVSPVGNAVGWQPGSVISIFISNGTATHPNAGLLVGNGFSFNAETCAVTKPCAGGRAGLLLGNGGSGWNGGNGGSTGFLGNGGNGGDGLALHGGTGGNGGSAGVFGNGGHGGNADPATQGRGGNGGAAGFLFGNGGQGGSTATIGGQGVNGGNGGNGGIFFSRGGRGGTAGPGAVECDVPICTVIVLGGAGGRGGTNGLFLGRAPSGAEALPLDSPDFFGYTPVYPPDGYFLETNTGILTNGRANPGTGSNFGYPNPYYIEGTTVDSVTLPAGFALARWGHPRGNFLAQDNTNFALLAVPPHTMVEPYLEFVVKDPAKLPPGWRIEQSQVAPGFGVYGGGIQYAIYQDATRAMPGSVQKLLEAGYLGYKN